MSKLLALAHKIRKDLVHDYTDDLDKFNIEQEISPIYRSNLAPSLKNILFCYIILAYDNESEWMEVHKDRMGVKRNILKKLGANFNDEVFQRVLAGTHEATQRVVLWFNAVYQTDWRWPSIRANFDYHAEMMMFATQLTPDKFSYDEEEKDLEGNTQLITVTQDVDMDKRIANNIKKAQCLEAGTKARLEGERLLKEIQTEFVNIDQALTKEGVPRLTKLVDILSHEEFIAKIHHDKSMS